MLPLIPIVLGAAAIAGGGLVVVKLRKGGPKIAAGLVQSRQIVDKWSALGGEAVVGKPVTHVFASPAFKGVALQGFRRADGARSTIYAHSGGTFLVRGGFYDVYTGMEGTFGMPLSDEISTKVNAAKRLGVKEATVEAKRQIFQNGELTWLKKSNHVFGRANGKVVYDSKPYVRKTAWYEEIGLGDALMVALGGPNVIVTLGIGAVVGSDVQKGILSKIPVIGPLAGVMVEGQRWLTTFQCKGAGAVNAATGTGSPGANGLCKAYRAKQGPLDIKQSADALIGAKDALKGGSGGGDAADAAGDVSLEGVETVRSARGYSRLSHVKV
jgi:hypothetical protein